MLIQQDIHPPVTSYQAGVQTLTGGGGGVIARQPALTLQVGSELDPGIRRRQEPNEDTLSVIRGAIPTTPSKPFVLLMVADGMGGQADGQEASRLAVQVLSTYVSDSLRSSQATSETFLPLLSAGVKSANRVLYQRNQEQRSDMGTTMTATLVVDATAYVAHVGDSRCYLYREPVPMIYCCFAQMACGKWCATRRSPLSWLRPQVTPRIQPMPSFRPRWRAEGKTISALLWHG